MDFALSLLKILALAVTVGVAVPLCLITYCFVMGAIDDWVKR